MMFYRMIALSTALSINASLASANSLDQKIINLIIQTSHNICNTTIGAKGRRTEAQIAGDVKAQLRGLAGKLMNGGLHGTATARLEEFEGLTQEATAEALRGDRTCREKLFEMMFAYASKSDVKAPAIDNPSTAAGNRSNPPDAGADGSLIGEWHGSINCRDRRAYALTININQKVGYGGSGTITWNGSNNSRGLEKITISSSLNVQESPSAAYFTSCLIQYAYNLNSINPSKILGQSTGPERCNIVLEK